MNYGSPYMSSINPNSYLQNAAAQMMPPQMPQQNAYQMPGQIQSQQMMQPVQQSAAPQQTFDFQGNFVTSYEQAKNTPYSDKVMVYLDTANDRVYIKSINEKGVPETKVLGLVGMENSVSSEAEKPANVEVAKTTTDVPIQIEENLKKLDLKYEKAISDLKTQIGDLKRKDSK